MMKSGMLIRNHESKEKNSVCKHGGATRSRWPSPLILAASTAQTPPYLVKQPDRSQQVATYIILAVGAIHDMRRTRLGTYLIMPPDTPRPALPHPGFPPPPTLPDQFLPNALP
jgi:hypothetical protein